MCLYDRLVCEKDGPEDSFNWTGSLRWYVREQEKGGFSFSCICALKDMSHEECLKSGMAKELFRLENASGKSRKRIYGADYVRTDDFSVFLPFREYGCLIRQKDDIEINIYGEVCMEEDLYIVKDGAYFICFKTDMKIRQESERLILCAGEGGWSAAAFHIEKERAISDCMRMFSQREQILSDNRAFWNDYLESCPVVHLKKEYVYWNEALKIREQYQPDDFLTRQLWHYWCLLINASEVEFNRLLLYMAPDKINWLGTWSNDGLLCMSALSLTNQRELARRLITSYLTISMTENGDFSWYMHGDGFGCYGLPGDSGRFSHGAPYFPQTVDYYIRNTGDISILSETAGESTVYEKLKKYILNLHQHRDMNGDCLIEWANLWETGWDDKGGPFFSSAALDEWVHTVMHGTDEEIAAFYAANQHPVTPIGEQVITLWSLRAMSRLAGIVKDLCLRDYCDTMAKAMIKAVEEKCWNKIDRFYYDIDVKRDTQIKVKNADALYWLNFEEDLKRGGCLLEHLNSTEEFNCCYVPMMSCDSVGFDPNGYWSGGHWPREMAFIAMGLHHIGCDSKAMELLIRAVMSGTGNDIAEVINPLTGKKTTGITKMAYGVMNIVALLDVTERVKWSPL